MRWGEGGGLFLPAGLEEVEVVEAEDLEVGVTGLRMVCVCFGCFSGVQLPSS